jgi:hypothetical protein
MEDTCVSGVRELLENKSSPGQDGGGSPSYPMLIQSWRTFQLLIGRSIPKQSAWTVWE